MPHFLKNDNIKIIIAKIINIQNATSFKFIFLLFINLREKAFIKIFLYVRIE